MRTRLVLGLLAAAMAISACGEALADQPTTTTISPAEDSSDLDAWRQCIIDRIGRLDSEISQETEEIDVRLGELSENLAGLPAELSRIRGQVRSLQDFFDSQTDTINAYSGTFATIEQAREDPEIAAVLDQLDAALATGTGLDAAQDALGALDSVTINALANASDRDMLLISQLAIFDTEETDVLRLRSELNQERDALVAHRTALVAERAETMTTLEAALDGQQSGDVDWSLCTGS